MSIFAISDLHLSFGVPQKSMTVFHGWENYEDRIKAAFLKRVKKEDTVILGGDISWGLKLEDTYKDFEFLEGLPCQKILIKGNHDLWWSTASKMEKFFKANNFKSFKILFNNAPDVFEAGTLPLTQISGVAVAIDKLEENRPDLGLIKYMYDELMQMSRVKILTKRDAAMLSFVIDGMHVLDFGALIGARGVCLRVGNMCASWIHNLLGINGSVRISVGAYNTMQQVRQVVKYIKDIVK